MSAGNTESRLATADALFDELEPTSIELLPYVVAGKHRLRLQFSASKVQSEMDLRAPDKLTLGYTRTMMDFLRFHPKPKQIGMIGLGGGSLAKHCYRLLPEASIQIAEISPEVIAFRDQFHIPADGPRFSVHCVDGACFVRSRPDHLDVLLVDGFDADGQPPQLCTQEFYDDCYRALTLNGVLVVNVCGGRDSVLITRMRRSFRNRILVLGGEESDNAIAFAAKGTIPKSTTKPFPSGRH